MNTLEIKGLEDLYHELADTKLRIALTRIIMEDASELQDEIDQNSEQSDFSGKMHMQLRARTMRLIDSQLRKKRLKYIARYTLPRVGQIAAVVLLIFYIGLSTAIAVSTTVRIRVMDLMIRMEDRYTELSLEEIKDASFNVPNNWLASYYPTYIPEGYELVRAFGEANNFEAEFRSPVGNRIIFAENDEYAITDIDTENASIVNRIINGKKVLTAHKNGICTLIWSDFDRYFILFVDGDLDLGLQIYMGMMRIR